MTVKKLIAILVAVLAVGASPAYAVTLVNPDGSRAEPFQSWADAAKVSTVDGTVTVNQTVGPCGATYGCASRTGKDIWISPDHCARSARWCRNTLLHEVGHLFDFQMPEWKRQVFRKIVKIGDEDPWWDTRSGFRTQLGEMFADIYAACALGHSRTFNMEIDREGRPTLFIRPREVRRACRLIRQPN